MEIDLDIRNFKQPKNSVFCGPYCAKMVLKHYGIRLRLQTIKEQGRCCGLGMADTGIVIGLRAAGLKPKLYTGASADPVWGKYPILYNTLNKKQIIMNLSQRTAKMKKTPLKKYLTELMEVVENGLTEFIAPTYKMITNKLLDGCPWVVAVRVHMLYNLYDKKKGEYGHFVVLQGFDDDNFIVNDPSFEYGGVHKLPKDQLLAAMHTWTNSAICVKKHE